MLLDPHAVKDIFLAAIDKPAGPERSAYLDAACGGEPALRQRVEALLKEHEQSGSFPDFMGAGDSDSVVFAPDAVTETRGDAAAPGDEREVLDFLTPPRKPGHLGRLGHYEIHSIIGRGGMGIVLKAFDERLDRVVAVKILAPQYAANAAARRRFIREAKAIAAVAHEHVVNVHAVETEPIPHIVMQFVQGVSLQDRLDQTGPLEVKEILRIGLQAACGLAAAHAQGLVHRDIKPANILLENGVERVKITDFGLARAVDDASVTQSGVIAGTPLFMSPEQAEGKPVDARSDLFSLGSVMYMMCTGHAPFRAESTMATLKRVCEDTPRPIREVNPDMPDWLCETIAKLQAKRPEERFRSAKEVADVLEQHLANTQRWAPASSFLSVEPVVAPVRDEPAWKQFFDGTDHRGGLLMHGIMLTGALVFVAGVAVLLLSNKFDRHDIAQVLMFSGLALIVPGLLIKQRLRVPYKGRMLRFEFSGIGGQKLFLDNALLARGGHGSPSELRARIADGRGIGDEIRVLAKGGIYSFHCRFFTSDASLKPAERRQDAKDAIPKTISPAPNPAPSRFLSALGLVTFLLFLTLGATSSVFVYPREFRVEWMIGYCGFVGFIWWLLKKAGVYRRESARHVAWAATVLGSIVVLEVISKTAGLQNSLFIVVIMAWLAIVLDTLVPSQRSSRSRSLPGIAVISAVAMLLFAGIATGPYLLTFWQLASLEVESNDPDVEIVVTQNDRPIASLRMATSQKIRLLDGTYWIEIVLQPNQRLRGTRIDHGNNAIGSMDNGPDGYPGNHRFPLEFKRGTHKKLTVDIVRKNTPSEKTDAGFVSLFNGSDLTGWKVPLNQPSNWRFENGVLIGGGGDSGGMLMTVANDISAAPARFDIMVNEGGEASIHFGVPETALSANVTLSDENSLCFRGVSGVDPGTYANGGAVVVTGAPNRWYCFKTSFDGAGMSYRWIVPDDSHESAIGVTRPSQGHIVLRARKPGTIVSIRKIEIKELPASSPELPKQAADVLPFLTGKWKGEFTQKIYGAKPAEKRFTAVAVNDWIVGQKWLRQRVHMEDGGFLSLVSFEPGAKTFRDWFFHARGLIFGPSTGRWDSATRTITWTNLPENGVILLTTWRFVDADTVAWEILIRDKEGEAIFEMTSRMKRSSENVTIDETASAGPLPLEMAALDRLVGDWEITGITKNAENPDGLKATWPSASRRILGGRIIAAQSTGHPGAVEAYSLSTFDTFSKAYARWLFKPDGNVLEYGGGWDEKTRTMKWHWAGKDGSQSTNTWIFRGTNRIDWQVFSKDAVGKTILDFQATSVRQSPELPRKAAAGQSHPVLLRKFDPVKEKAVAPRGDPNKITVENGAWRIENALDYSTSGNFNVLLANVTENIPTDGVLILRAKVKLQPKHKDAWGDLMLGDASPSFHGYDWPAHLAEFRGDVPEWTAKEVRYPVEVFRKKEPFHVPVYVGLHANGVLWVKDLELLHVPGSPRPAAPARPPADPK